MKEKKSLWLITRRQMNCGAIVSGIGFLLFLAASALSWDHVAFALSVVFGLIAFYVFLSTLAGRSRDKDEVSYSIMWGMASLTLLMLGTAVLTVKMYLGL